eukprot:3050820-Prymnesium_polylepis.1
MTCLGLLYRVHRTLVLYRVDACFCCCCLGCTNRKVDRCDYTYARVACDDAATEQLLHHWGSAGHHPVWVARALQHDCHSIPACSLRLTVGERLSGEHAPMLDEGKNCIIIVEPTTIQRTSLDHCRAFCLVRAVGTSRGMRTAVARISARSRLGVSRSELTRWPTPHVALLPTWNRAPRA